jgi:methyl-accepting chemotaxis protein
MKSLLDLRLRSKLFCLFAVVVALFGAALWNAYHTMTGLVQFETSVQAAQADAVAFARMDSNRNESRVAGLMLLGTAATENEPRQRYVARVRELAAANAEIRRLLFQRNREDTWMMARLQEYQSTVDIYNRVRENVLELALQDRDDEARRISMGEQDQRFTTLRQLGEAMFAHAQKQTEQTLERSTAAIESARRFYLIIGLGVAAVVLIAVWALGRMISDPLREVVAAAERISRGDLRTSISGGDRQDEIGQLARAFQRMIENLRSMQREVQEGVNVLATSATEIFTATAQIATSATETATAVSQTTSTAEEVKQTAQVSAQKAGNVADIAQRAAQAAQTGRKAIDESITGMQHIREQMELIAETVVRLSEQSQAIGEIITSVNDLAEQSNLLAVNASIEAAKAGEHGKGFAVVAQEIRSLATQSKESTEQVRKILHDIQRATTATVMAAEQGSKAVDGGVKQVNQSGDTIRTLAESIFAAAQAATQITASAQEQLVGIDQVTIAIQNIFQASKQNATATQQAEAGAKNLNQLGQNLKAVAQKFAV